jgi:hypothetical protein
MSFYEEKIKECMRNLQIDINRYYYTVQLTLGFKDYLDKNSHDCRFIAAEKNLKLLKNDKIELHPDFFLQYNDDKNGIVTEIKTSISDEVDKLSVIKGQLNNYNENIIGWQTKDEKIDDHDILYIVHSLDSDQLKQEIENSIKNDQFKIRKNFCLSEFSYLTSTKYNEGDIILIKHKYGKVGCDELNNNLIDNIKIFIDKLVIEYDRYKFTRKEPPDEYLMFLLWTLIFPNFLDKNSPSFEVSLDTLVETTQTYFSSWSGIPGEGTQIRKNWIKRAMTKFIEIGLVELLHENPLTYFVPWKKLSLPNDMGEYILTSCCEIKLKSMGITKSIGKTQKSITDFGL